MNTWYTKNLGDPMLAGESLNRIKARFLSEFEKAGNPNEMAVFVRHESEGRLHCEVLVYFSPASAIAAEAVGGVPCKRPSPHDLGLLVGPEESWPILFPEN